MSQVSTRLCLVEKFSSDFLLNQNVYLLRYFKEFEKKN